MTTLPQDQVNGAFAHGAPVLLKPTHGGIIPPHGGVVKPQHGIEYVVSNDPSVGYALYLPFSAASPTYRVGATTYTDPTTLPGYSFTRSGTQGAVDASGAVQWFAANVPAINSAGYHAYGALTNYLIYSQDLNNAAWTKNQLSVIANSIAAPDGTMTADTLTTSGVALTQELRQADAQTAIRTYSVFAKAGTGRYLQLILAASATTYANFDLIGGVLGTVGTGLTSASISACGNGWYRCVIVIPANAANDFIVQPVLASNSAFNASYSSAVDTFYSWQAQSLLGNHPDGGPIIVTAGATASIGASALENTITAPADVECLVWATATPSDISLSYAAFVSLRDATAANEIFISVHAGNYSIFVTAANVNLVTSTAAAVANQKVTLLVLRKGGTYRCGKVVGGVLTWFGAASGALAWPAGMTTVRSASGASGNNLLNGQLSGEYIKVGTYANDAAVLAAVAEAP